MARHSPAAERVAPFVASDETVVGAIRTVRGPRPGTEVIALAVNVPLLTFSPAGIVPTLLLGVALAALILAVIAWRRRLFLVAVTDQVLLLLDCGQMPGRWTPNGVAYRGGWQPIVNADRASARRSPRLEVDGRTYWIAGTDQAELRRLSRWITKHE